MISLHLLHRPDVGVTSPLDLQPLLQGACARFELCFSSIFLLKIYPERVSRSHAPPGRMCPNDAIVAYPEQKVTVG
jgi:hypothetical protein